MKAIFFLKVNNQIKKVFEEDLPEHVKDNTHVMGLVAFGVKGSTMKVERYVKFTRMNAPLVEDAMFMFDVDEYTLSESNKQNL